MCFPSALDSAKVTTCFMESLYLLNITGNGNYLDKYPGNFCLAPNEKLTGPGEFKLIFIFPR